MTGQQNLKLRDLKALFKEGIDGYIEDKVPVLGAALSYYTIFSLAPLLVILIAIAALVLGEKASQGYVLQSLRGSIGDSGAAGVQDLIRNARRPDSGGFLATSASTVILLVGATSVFAQLQTSLNLIWRVAPKPGAGIWATIRQRFLTVAMVVSIGFLLLVSLVVSTTLAALGKFLSETLPGGEALWHAINFVISFGVITTLFAMMFRILPDVRIRWSDVWVGAAFTAFLFTLGKLGIGLYLGKSSVGSAYGAASSLVLFLVWVYYASQIFFFGAEVTKAYANRYGAHALPKKDAISQSPRRLSMGESLRVIENPLPHLREAKAAAIEIFNLQRQIARIETRLAARRQARRTIFLIASAVLLFIAMTLGSFWASMALHESARWSPWLILLASLLVFSPLAAGSVWRTLHPEGQGKEHGKKENSRQPGTPATKQA